MVSGATEGCSKRPLVRSQKWFLGAFIVHSAPDVFRELKTRLCDTMLGGWRCAC